MPYRRFGSRRSRPSLAFRQGGTGATYSGSQNLIRHAFTKTATIGSGKTQAFDLVTFNPTNHGTPLPSDGASTKVLPNNFTDTGSRVDYVTMQLTVKQTDTSKNNTIYMGLISTSYTGHVLIGSNVTNVKFNIKKTGTPPSTAKFKCVTLDSSNTVQQVHGSEMLMSDVPATYGLVDFNGVDVPYFLQNDDRLALISTGTGSDGSNAIIAQLCSSCTPSNTTGGYEQSGGWTNRSDRSYTMEATASSGGGTRLPPSPIVVHF